MKSLLVTFLLLLSGPYSGLFAQQRSDSNASRLDANQQERLQRGLAAKNHHYDSVQHMLQTPFTSPGYSTQLKGGMVHATLTSLVYAAALLDTRDNQTKPRAFAILNRVIDLQDQNPASKTYGAWPWFLEEPLNEMAHADLNWADFCATQLLEIVLNHNQELPEDLATKIQNSIIHAARSIQQRNIILSYTNILIMGTFVTLVASERYQLNDLHQYALQRLKLFYEYTKANGAFTEYNSPNYTTIALNELGRLKQYAKDPTALQLINELYTFTWNDIAQHFHAPTHQWAGPHSRNYNSLLTDGIVGLLQRATGLDLGYKNSTPSLDDYQIDHHCPDNLIPYFAQLTSPRQLIKTIYKPSSEQYNTEYAQLRPGASARKATSKSVDVLPPTLISTTYLHTAFTLGTANYSDFWNQRRALIAYWGTATAPVYMHLRFLHNNYDFAAAQFFSVQDQGQTLAGVNFATNGGDTHISLDPLKNASFQATDLRLRFEFGGSIKDLVLNAPSSLQQPAIINLNGTTLYLSVPFAIFDKYQGRWDVGQDKTKAWLDVVLYAGQAQTFDLNQISKAGLGISVQFSQSKPVPVKVDTTSNQLSLQQGSLRLQFPIKPSPQLTLQKQFTSQK